MLLYQTNWGSYEKLDYFFFLFFYFIYDIDLYSHITNTASFYCVQIQFSFLIMFLIETAILES